MAVISTTHAVRNPRRDRLRRKVGDNVMAYAFMVLGIACFAMFSWWPMIRGIILSFQKFFAPAPAFYVGTQNYHQIFADPMFWPAIRNTFQFTGFALLFGYVVPFALAVMLNEMRHFKGYFRFLVYLPVMLPPLVSVLIWNFFYNTDNGLFDTILHGVGIPESQFTQAPTGVTAMVSMVLASTWANAGGATLLYMAGLATIPGELYEAAELDGASIWQRVRHVIIPQMRFIMLVLLLLQIIATMQTFIEPFEFTGFTDPQTITVVVLIYRYAFAVQDDLGLAAAMSVLLFIVLGIFAAIYLRVTRDRD
jgi:multiple sugar transport system permease protein